MSVIAYIGWVIGGIVIATIIGMIGCALKVASDVDNQTGAEDSYE